MAICGSAFALWLAVAAATEPPFTITTEGGTYEVLRRATPPPRDLSTGDHTCRVGLSWADGRIAPRDLGCPREVISEVTAAVSHWSIQGPQDTPSSARASSDLGEVWFVYPDAFGPPRLLVRQAHDRLLSLPSDVDAVPYGIRLWSFVRWPEESHREDHPDVRCEVEVEANIRGVTTDVSVTGCDEPFRSTVAQTIGQWRFEPAIVNGSPIPTALSLATTFVAEAPSPLEAPAETPSERSQRLWAERQFGLLTREERVWFIRATLLGGDERDLGPGQVLVSLPPPPVLGERAAPTWADEAVVPVPELPDHPPVMLLGAADKVGIEVFSMNLPNTERSDGVRRCPMVVQVDSTRRVMSWSEASCDASLRNVAIETADTWILRLLPSEGTSPRGRFRARLEATADGAMSIVLPAEEVRTALSALPAGVHTEQEAVVSVRVPPKLPRDLSIEEGSCELSVAVDARGRPDDVRLLEGTSCPDGARRAATAAVKRWRWRPAERDGVPIPSTATVAIRFQP